MGNTKSKKSTTKPTLTTFDPSLLDEEKELAFYLSNDTSDIDTNHIFHFLKKCLFQNCFSSPVKDRLIQGGSKVLDVG